jgi:hypothetical protein
MRVGDQAMPVTAKYRPCCCAALAAIALVAVMSSAAWPQGVAPPAANAPGPAQLAPVQPAAPAPQPQSAPGSAFPAPPSGAEKPGFIAELGRLLDDARGKLSTLPPPPNLPPPPGLPPPPSLPPPPNEAAKDAANATQNVVRNAAEATKDAVTAIGRIPATRVFEVRALCPLAPNGAPDCRVAATNACRGKGFNSGDPVNVRSSENCPPAVLLSGRQPSAGECPTETVVLAAACH